MNNAREHVCIKWSLNAKLCFEIGYPGVNSTIKNSVLMSNSNKATHYSQRAVRDHKS